MDKKDEIVKGCERLGPWGQRIQLANDIHTCGSIEVEQRWDFIKRYLPKNLKGLRVLDIGCSAGFFSIKMKELGAQHIVGIDFEHYICQAKFVSEILGSSGIQFRAQSIYKLDANERFNLVVCLGVLYHLRYPFLALQKISEAATDMVLLETEALVSEEDTDKMKFIEHTFQNDSTNWWIFGEECLRGMLRSVGFRFVKVYSYPEQHPIFGKHYSQGLTAEGVKKAKRVVVVGLKNLDPDRIGMLLSEMPELESEIDLNDLRIKDSDNKKCD